MPPKAERLEKTFFWVLMTVLIIGFFWLLAPFFSPIIFALVLALVADPLYRLLMKWSRGQRFLSAIFCLFVLFLFVAIPAGVVGTLVTNQLLRLAQTFNFDPNFLDNFLGRGFFSQTVTHVEQTFGVEIDIGQWLKEMLHHSAEYLYQFSPRAVARTANFFLMGLVTLFLTYFFLVDGPKLYHTLLDLSPLEEKHEKVLALEIRQTVWACIYGYILTALVQAILATLGFAILKLPIFLLLGLATFILSFIPFLGTASVWIPVVIYLLATGNYGQAAFLGIYGTLVISGVDNILKPMLIQDRTKIHTMLLFLAIFGGIKLWGPIGILAGPMLIAVFLATLKIYRQDFR